MSSFDTPVGPVRIAPAASRGEDRKPVDLRGALDWAMIAVAFGFVAALTVGVLV